MTINNITIPALALILIVILVSRRVRFMSPGAKIESGLWRVLISALTCSVLALVLLEAARLFQPDLPELSGIAVKIAGAFLFVLSLRSVPGTFAGQPDLLGHRSEISVSEGITAVIPFLEKLVLVSVGSKDFQMGTSNMQEDSETKRFVVTAHGSDAAETLSGTLRGAGTNIYLDSVQAKEPTKSKVDERGYNNMVITATVVYRTSNPRQYLLVEGKNIDEKDTNIEKRLAKIVATRARHYSANVTDDFIMREKDILAERILQDMNPQGGKFLKGGHSWEQIELLGQQVIAINISFADFEDQRIKNAQASLKVEAAEAKAEKKQATAIGDQVKALALELGMDLKIPANVKLLLDVVQAERGKATRLVGDNAGNPAFFGQVRPNQPTT